MWETDAEFCLEHGDKVLRPNEREFLEDILDRWDGELTWAQEDWLEKIKAKVESSLDPL